ncbi:MAG TPA: hypothetical protein VGD78_08340 [Chthoniobacterales bacterium]
MPPITPQAVQELLDDLQRNREARKRAWLVLQNIRARLEHWQGDELPKAGLRSFDAEGATLLVIIDKLFAEREAALKNLADAIRRFQATIFESEKESDRAGAHQAVLNALDVAEALIIAPGHGSKRQDRSL